MIKTKKTFFLRWCTGYDACSVKYNLFFLLVGIIFFVVLLSSILPQVSAAITGCCCDPITRTGGFQPQPECAAEYLFFPNISVGQTCGVVCDARLPPALPQNCTTQEPQNVVARPLAGQPVVLISWQSGCGADSADVERCLGSSCTAFTSLVKTQSTSYLDQDTDLVVGQDIKYRVRFHYDSLNMTTQYVVATTNLGDIECQGQAQDVSFCISPFFYIAYKKYFVQKGYQSPIASIPAVSREQFIQSFDATINTTFFSRFNTAFMCGQDNKLHQQWGCTVGSACVNNPETQCAQLKVCRQQTTLFGIYTTTDLCEKDQNATSYCFFDRSSSITNQCYACNPRMNCYDYRTKESCQRDNCGVGASTVRVTANNAAANTEGQSGGCEWRETIPQLGIGVCVDAQKNNCIACDQTENVGGIFGLDNHDAYNPVFDACTPEKAQALGRPDDAFQCFYTADENTAIGCDTASCVSFKNQQQCATPSAGIQLDATNALRQSSADPCSIRVCQWYASATGGRCAKNADGRSDIIDCVNATCEQDYFPPITTLVAQKSNGTLSGLSIRVLDKTTKQELPTLHQGYTTFLCVKTPTQSCANAQQFSINTTSQSLSLQDLTLLDGQMPVAHLLDGVNTLFYYSIDSARNLEIVKNTTFFACTNCQGPQLIKISILPSRAVNQTVYTNQNLPRIELSFNVPAELIPGTGLTQANQTIAVQGITPGYHLNYTLTPTRVLQDGSYVLVIQARAQNGVIMSQARVLTLVIDTQPPRIQFGIAGETKLNTTQTVIPFTSTEPMDLPTVSYTEETYLNGFAKKISTIQVSEQDVISQNNQYQFVLRATTQGVKKVQVLAKDFAGNTAIATVTYYVLNQAPEIRMVSPSFGVTTTQTFDVGIETSIPATCKLWFNAPPLPVTQFDQLSSLATNNSLMHTQQALSLTQPTGLLTVYCKNAQGIRTRTYTIVLDPNPPQVAEFHAFPNPVFEGPPFVTQLSINLNKPGFCKYSTTTTNYALMENTFPEFQEEPRTTHTDAFSTNGTITVNAACESPAGRVSQTKTILVQTNATAKLSAISTTPVTTNSTNITLGVQTNKKAVCYVGYAPDNLVQCMSNCTFEYAHVTTLEGISGNNTYYASCTTPNSQETTTPFSISVLADITAPLMQFVNDTAYYETNGAHELLVPGFPDVSFFTDRIMVGMFASDNETRVMKYVYSVETVFGNAVVIPDTEFNVLNGSSTWVLLGNTSLADQTEYRFSVRAVNAVGRVSEAMKSDGVLIDASKKPGLCANKQKDENETDLDCGKSCGPTCQENKSCITHNDCVSLYCSQSTHTCAQPSCTDNIKNGKESDIDCGGACAPCSIGKVCTQHTDCNTQYCAQQNATCGTAPLCSDNVLSSGESDIDCGGSCTAKCSQGQTCVAQTDCAQALLCANSRCQTCNGNDCGPYSCGDNIPDAWRQKYFNTLSCTGQGAQDADPDHDGLRNGDEHLQHTDPTRADTDGDGWNDMAELAKGTNPVDASDHPSRRVIFWIIGGLSMVLLCLAGYYRNKWLPYLGRKSLRTVQHPFVRQVPQYFFRKSKELSARKKIHESSQQDQEVNQHVFEKDFSQETVSSERQGVAEKSKLTIFDRLKLIALQKLPQAEQQRLLKEFEALKQGTLAEQERNQLFAKLKITSTWYELHKETLHKELSTWLGRKK